MGDADEKTMVDNDILMELERLRTEISDIKEKTFDDKGNFIRQLTDEELDALDRP